MVVFPENFEHYMGKAVQELGEKVYGFDPDLLLAVLRAGRLVGFAVEYYIQNLYGQEIPMEYVHASTGRNFEGRKFVIVNTNDLQKKEEIIKGKRIAVLDDCHSSYLLTMKKIVSYTSENLSPLSIEKFCLFNDTFLIEEMTWEEWDKSDINPRYIGWHEFFSKYSGRGEFHHEIKPDGDVDLERSKYYSISDELNKLVESAPRSQYINFYRKWLKDIEEVETKIKELIDDVIIKSKSKP